MRAVVILMNRIGDIVQSVPLLSALQRDGYSVELVVWDGFGDITTCIPWVQRVYRVPKTKEFIGWAERISSDGEIDLLINLTPSFPGAALMARIEAKEKRGLGIARGGNGVARGRWTAYYLSVPSAKDLNLINVCDHFMYVGGCHKPLPQGPLMVSSHDSHLLTRETEFAVLCPGASSYSRQWGIAKYVELAKRIRRTFGLEIVILGTKNESILGKMISEKVPCADLTGETSVPEIVSLIGKCTFLVGSDSAPLHIAAMMKRPTIGLFLDTAQFWSTGAYGEGHKALIGQDISVDAVWSALYGPPQSGVFVSGFDGSGLVEYRALNGASVLTPSLLIGLLTRFTAVAGLVGGNGPSTLSLDGYAGLPSDWENSFDKVEMCLDLFQQAVSFSKDVCVSFLATEKITPAMMGGLLETQRQIEFLTMQYRELTLIGKTAMLDLMSVTQTNPRLHVQDKLNCLQWVSGWLDMMLDVLSKIKRGLKES